MGKRILMLFAWTNLVMTTYPHLADWFFSPTWQLRGLTGLLLLHVGIPVFVLSVASALVVTVQRYYTASYLLPWGGALSAVGLMLMWGFSNSGGLPLVLLGAAFLTNGRVMNAMERRANRTVNTGV